MRKVHAEPGMAPGRDGDGALVHDNEGHLVWVETTQRWVGTGRTVFDNEGEEAELVEWGVTPILRYDGLGRLTRTDLPNGTYSKVDFDPWKETRYDPNDTVADSGPSGTAGGRHGLRAPRARASSKETQTWAKDTLAKDTAEAVGVLRSGLQAWLVYSVPPETSDLKERHRMRGQQPHVSARAQAYLASLQRHEAPSAERLADALQRSGCPVFDTWIDFQTRYAGYEESLGDDCAIWGIVHDDSRWVEPGEAAFDHREGNWRVVCADVHPSHDYLLSSSGELSSYGGGGRCESFDFKVERDALVWETTAGEREWTLDLELPRLAGPGIVDLVKREGGALVGEASDRFAKCYRARDIVAIVRGVDAIVWVACDSLSRILTQVDSGG